MSSEFLPLFFVTILIEIPVIRDLAEKAAVLILNISNPYALSVIITTL